MNCQEKLQNKYHHFFR